MIGNFVVATEHTHAHTQTAFKYYANFISNFAAFSQIHTQKCYMIEIAAFPAKHDKMVSCRELQS